MVDEFMNTLAKTNRSHLFYVDWKKARGNLELYKDELALLQVLGGDNVDVKAELLRLISSYPRINSLIPLLAACRIKAKKGVENLLVIDEEKAENVEYNFGSKNLTSQDIKLTVTFAEKVGLLDELSQLKSPADYYFGVEVGMDTNARKNRSGSAMETLVEGHVKQLVEEFGGQYLVQTKFKDAAARFDVATPPHQETKKGDFMLLIKGKPYNIETNYFSDSGSKQEIMNSYIPRANDLREAGWGFALVTDGQGWLSNRKQLEEGYQRIRHIYNIKMCTDGKLSGILGS